MIDIFDLDLKVLDFPKRRKEDLVYLNPNFDFYIDPNHFMEWLKLEGEDVIGNYEIDCCAMCEYACLYISMMLHNKKLCGDMKIYYGKFGTMLEHYWIGYAIDGEEYFIDLTLKQFVSDAPKLAIVKAENERISGSYSSLSEGEPIKEYIKRQRAFMFYANPITMTKSDF